VNIPLPAQPDQAIGVASSRVAWAGGGRAPALLYGFGVVLAMLGYFFLTGVLAASAYVVVSGLALVALLAGIHIHHPRNPWPWRWLAFGQAAFMVGDLLWFVDDLAGTSGFPSMADVSYLTGYPLFAIGLGLFIVSRRPRYSLARLVDATAIGLTALMLLLLAYVPGIASQSGLAVEGKLTLLAYPAGDAILLGGAAFLLFGGSGWRGRAQQALLVGLLLLAAADVLYGLFLSDTDYARSVLDAMWMLSYGAVGLAALLPSMRELTEPQAGGAEAGSTRATMALLVAVAVLTAFALVDEVADGTAQHVVLELAQVTLLGLLFLRAHEATTRESRHERRVAALLANASDALVVIDQEGIIRLSNPAAERLLGINSRDAVGRSFMDFVERLHPDDRVVGPARMQAVMTTPGSRDESEVRVRQRDGEYRWLRISMVNRVADPAVGAVVLTMRDIQEQRESERQLARLGAAIDQSSEAVIIANVNAEIEYVNPAFERITGYSTEEVIGRNPRLLSSGAQPRSFYVSMWEALTSGRPWVADFVNKRKDGSLYQASAVVSPIRNAEGAMTGYVGVSRDVSEERRQEGRAVQVARERALIGETLRGIDAGQSPEETATAICNQIVRLPDIATAALVIFERDGSALPYGLVVESGAAVPLLQLPKRRVDQVRERALTGPWIEAWEDRPWHPYNELLTNLGVRSVAYAPIRGGGEMLGYLLISSAADNAEEVLSMALPALVEFGDISGTLLAAKVGERTRASIERGRIESIIKTRAFQPVYQPLVDLETRRIVGYEALTRFDDGVAPDLRFAEAHAVRMGVELELGAIRMAIQNAAPMSREMWLNINASPAVVMDGGELQEIANECERDLVLEVTEHTAITDYPAFRRAVRALGPRVRLAVDDAGAGFASLRHIIELRPTFVKLDRQVIARIDKDEARQAMVAGLRHFALNTGCWLIAEGVETRAELKTLHELEVRYVQGYLVGRPAPAQGLNGEMSSRALQALPPADQNQ
jgi:PAS domain S-box-containing protein